MKTTIFTFAMSCKITGLCCLVSKIAKHETEGLFYALIHARDQFGLVEPELI